MFSVLLLLSMALVTASAATDKLVCYYGSWARYRPDKGKFLVSNIVPNLCTHLIYGFVGIKEDGTISILDSWNDITLRGFADFNLLKKRSANLKTLVAIGGWNAGSQTFSKVVSNPTIRAQFVARAVTFLKTYGFDGLDLDWEYPSQRAGLPTDKNNFSKLLAELRKAFAPNGFLLTAAVAATASSIDISYDVPQLSRYLDFINVMTYDLHTSADGKTGQNAPLFASNVDRTPAEKEKNVDACIKAWIKRGANPSKLILGVGTYGRTYTLSNANNAVLGAPTRGAGAPGPYTQEPGMLGYNEICEKLKTGKWKTVWDNQQKVPFAYSGNQWVGYDDTKSVEIKVNYAKDNKLGGVMVWSIDTDDFRGTCGAPYPILNKIKSTLAGRIAPRWGLPDDDKFICTVEGYARDPNDCENIIYCHRVGDTFDLYERKCPSGLYFDVKNLACKRPELVQC